jgi:hypothetical protein
MVASHPAGEALQAIAEEQRRVAGTGGVILVCDGGSEEHHRAVAGELVDRAVEAVHALGDERVEPVHQRTPRLVVDAPGELHRALHVDEHDGDLLALPLRARRRRDDDVLGERVAAPVAELLPDGVRRTTRSAPDRGAQLGAALTAEPRRANILGAALRAGHRPPSGGSGDHLRALGPCQRRIAAGNIPRTRAS